jgi:hypothetical protein
MIRVWALYNLVLLTSLINAALLVLRLQIWFVMSSVNSRDQFYLICNYPKINFTLMPLLPSRRLQ